MPVYVWTAPGPDVKGGLAHILLRVFRAAFIQSKRRWWVTANSTLLAAEVAVIGACGKAGWSPLTVRSPGRYRGRRTR